MKKGFTLIELLAVILVLALIITIVTPILTNTISKSKESIYKSDIKLYAESIKKAVLAYEMKYKVMPTKLSQIQQFMEKDGNEVSCETTIIYDRDNIYLEKCRVDGKEVKDYTFGQKPICTLIEGKEKEIGSKYQCKVKDDMEEEFKDGYYFYVLSTEKDGTYNLIMDRNMCVDGTPTTSTNTCNVAWNESGSNADGPVTAMKYLYNATKTWINVPPLNYEYKDKEWQESVGVTFAEESGYESFISVNGEGKINGTKFTETEPLRARMPIYARDDGTKKSGEVSNPNESNTYLYNYMDEGGGISSGETSILKIYGYWTLSSDANISSGAWYVDYRGVVTNFYTVNENNLGVRPVINIKF